MKLAGWLILCYWVGLFLAAMSSSRSDVVTQSVRPSVRPFVCHLFFLLVSWRHMIISGISQLLLIRFWPNFNGRILGPCLKTVMVTFVQATYMPWWHFNMSAVTGPILTKKFGPNLGVIIFVDQTSLGTNLFQKKISEPKFFSKKNFGPKIS